MRTIVALSLLASSCCHSGRPANAMAWCLEAGGVTAYAKDSARCPGLTEFADDLSFVAKVVGVPPSMAGARMVYLPHGLIILAGVPVSGYSLGGTARVVEGDRATARHEMAHLFAWYNRLPNDDKHSDSALWYSVERGP